MDTREQSPKRDDANRSGSERKDDRTQVNNPGGREDGSGAQERE